MSSILPPLNASNTLPPLTASGPTTILPPLSASSAALSETKTAPSPSAPALTLPTLLPPLRVPLPPVERYGPRWLDCLFWLSAKNGGGYIRVEDVDHLVRSNADLPPLQQRGMSSRTKRLNLPALPAQPSLTLPPLPTATCPSDGYANAGASTVQLPSSVSAAALTLPPIPSN